MEREEEIPHPDSERTWADDILERTADELDDLSLELRRFEHDLSSILEKAKVSPEQIRRLQFLDETTQILEDLSRAVRIVEGRHAFSLPGFKTAIRESIVLGDLRLRLCGDVRSKRRTLNDALGDVSLF